MRIVLALGGNALSQRGEPMEADLLLFNIRQAMPGIAKVVREHEVLLTHGNGPQIGFLSLIHERLPELAPWPLDLLSSEAAGLIGSILARELRNTIPGHEVVTTISDVVVAADDPAFEAPAKPVGQGYQEAEIRELAAAHGWSIARDGDHWRRVVPSPEPVRIPDASLLRGLIAPDRTVIAAGGGGTPVTEEGGALAGIEAVIDKDLTAALLAREVGADLLVILTDVDCVHDGWGTDDSREIGTTTAAALGEMQFDAGTMGPKVRAACRFVSAGRRAAIGHLNSAHEVVTGSMGTQIYS